eukprot:2869668-Prymnesium_polylepis.1
MSDGSMRPAANPTLRHAASIIAVLTQWNHTPGSCRLGLPPQISKNSGSPIEQGFPHLPRQLGSGCEPEPHEV